MSGTLRGLLVVAAVGLVAAVVFLGGGADRLARGPSRAEEPGAGVSAAKVVATGEWKPTKAAKELAKRAEPHAHGWQRGLLDVLL